MNAGYVYVLINPSMPGLIKIGRTLLDSRQRARQLHTTGVPTPFQLAFELFSEDHETLEASVHERLRDFRVAENREFFRYPLDKAISLLLEISTPPTREDAIFVAEDITDKVVKKYSDYLKPEIRFIRIVQSEDRVWLETTIETEIAGYLKDQQITRTDLGFIQDYSEIPLFNPDDSISINITRFLDEFDAHGICMTVDLFTENACREICGSKQEPQDTHEMVS